MKTHHLRIHGRVQGVWFRESMRLEAERLNVTGWVRNTPDGAVEAVHVLEPVFTLAAEQPAYVYRDSRDMTGFIDGTENPPVE